MLGQQGQEISDPALQQRSLSHKPIWAKLLVLAAGPLANFVLPLVIYFFIFLGQTTQYPATVGGVLDGSPAALAGLQTGDRIVAIDGEEVDSWGDMVRVVSASPERELHLEIERGKERVERFVIPRRTVRYNDLGDREDVGQLGILMHSQPQIAIVGPDAPAALEGLRDGTYHFLQRRTGGDGRGPSARSRGPRLAHSPHLPPRRGGRQPLGTTLVYRSAHAQILPRKESD